MSNGSFQQTPKKISKSSSTADISCCRLWKSAGVARRTFMQKEYRALLAAAEDICRRPLRQDKSLPQLLCRPCEHTPTPQRG